MQPIDLMIEYEPREGLFSYESIIREMKEIVPGGHNYT